MARPPIFPLPDDQVRTILRGIDELGYEHSNGTSTRQFLGNFIEIVHSITGKRYGASTYRKMLSLYVPSCNPSTETLQDEIRKFQDKRDALAPQVNAIAVLAASSPAAVRPPKDGGSSAIKGNVIDSTLELAMQQSIENKRLRQRIETASQQLSRAGEQRTALLEAIAGHVATNEAQAAANLDLHKHIQDLTASISIIQQRSDATMRHALLQVESVRKETREAETERDIALRRIDALQTQLKNAQAMIESFRRQLNQARAISHNPEVPDQKRIES